MCSPEIDATRRSTVGHSIRRAALLALVATGCLSWPGAEARRQAEVVAEGNALASALAAIEDLDPFEAGLRVRLAFGEKADLDLYVTDPLEETVYFANNPTRSGGRLDTDVRCDAPPPRIETVTFPDPLPGRYRIGVDFSERCEGRDRPVPFVVTVHYGRVRREQRGTLVLHRFEPIVLEVTLPSPG